MMDSTNERPGASGLARIRVACWLAYWQFRQVWRLILVMSGIALLGSVLVCSIPLLSRAAAVIALHNAFDPAVHPESQVIRVSASAGVLSPDQIASVASGMDGAVRQQFGALASDTSTLTVTSWTYPLFVRKLDPARPEAAQQVRFVSAPGAVMRAHLAVVRGVLPQQRASGPLEVVISETTARAWRVDVGSILYLEVLSSHQGTKSGETVLPLRVVGIASPQQADVIFGQFLSDVPTSSSSNTRYAMFGNLEAMLALAAQEPPQALTPDEVMTYSWTYAMDAAHLQLDQVAPAIAAGKVLSTQLEQGDYGSQHVEAEYLDGSGFLTRLGTIQARNQLFQGPVMILMLELIAFVLCFLGVMADIAVAWQRDAIGTLRNRGMEQVQMFGAFAVQALVISLVGGVLGPVVAALAVAPVSMGGGAGVWQLSPGHIVAVAWSVAAYAAISAGAFVLAMIVALARAARANALADRQARAREARHALWPRQLAIALILVGGIGFIAYRDVGQSVGNYAVHMDPYLLAFNVAMPLLLTAAIALLVVTAFPLLLRLVAYVVSLSRGAIPTIALAKIARAPRQAITITWVVAIAACMASLTVVTVATQQQRASDLAAATVGSDFQGITAQASIQSAQSLAQRYRSIPGVIAVSCGTTLTVPYEEGEQDVLIKLLAMDAETFGNTVSASPYMSNTALEALTQQLVADRPQAESADVVPAIVDAAMWNTLELSEGKLFMLPLPGYTQAAMKFEAVGRVAYLPSALPTSGFASGEGGIAGGLLVDYQTLKTVYSHDVPNNTLSPDTVWLRTQHDAATLAAVRSDLRSGPLRLTQVEDRVAAVAQYQRDPLQNDLLVGQFIVTCAVLVLALLALVQETWLAATQRRLEFAFLHALGINSGQLRWIILWEEVFCVVVGLVLGILLSWPTMHAIVPMLAATQLLGDSAGSGSLALDTPPVRLVVPVGILTLIAGVILCVGLSAVYVLAGREIPDSMGETLRVNQD